MGRGLFSGLLWGSLVAVMSLWVLSQVGGMVGLLEEPSASISAPPSGGTDAADLAQASSDQDVVPPVSPDEAQSDQARLAEPPVLSEVQNGSDAESQPIAEAEPDPVETAETVAVLNQPAPSVAAVSVDTNAPADPVEPRASNTGRPVVPNADAPPVQVPSPLPPQQAPQTSSSVEQPPVQDADAVDQPETTAAETTAPASGSGPSKPQIPRSETSPGVAPGGSFANPVEVPTPEIDPDATEPAEPETEVAEAAPEIVPNAEVLDGDGELESQGTLASIAQDVRTNRLPSIGGATAVEETQSPDAQIEAGEATVPPSGGLAIRQFAAEFSNEDNRPLMAILLLPDPESGAVADTPLPFPVTYVVDASLDSATQAMRRYRDDGFEVTAMMPLPSGASPQDVETSFAVYFNRVPEAVAVIDTDQAMFQSGRGVATQVAQVLAATGHGMITYSKGLNSAPQLAEREGVPAALVFRSIDGNGQDLGAIKRFLDQAAFRAGQQSGVVLVGHNRPETVTALMEWSLGNRAHTVALAPVSAVLMAQ